jgi:hypothetical protein
VIIVEGNIVLFQYYRIAELLDFWYTCCSSSQQTCAIIDTVSAWDPEDFHPDDTAAGARAHKHWAATAVQEPRSVTLPATGDATDGDRKRWNKKMLSPYCLLPVFPMSTIGRT